MEVAQPLEVIFSILDVCRRPAALDEFASFLQVMVLLLEFVEPVAGGLHIFRRANLLQFVVHERRKIMGEVKLVLVSDANKLSH